MDALQLVRDRVRRAGPIGFDEYLEIALYAPGAGFYAGGSVGPAGSGGGSGAGVGAGRGGHFLTSPELGPLFGAVLARACDAWWDELGRPDPFVVVEAAAGAGTLARAVLDAGPACLPALRYLMVERSDALRAGHAAVVPLEPAATLLGPMAGAEEDDPDGARGIPGRGPRIASLAELPAGPLTGVVLANELLDNLPFSLLERTAGGWAEVRVGEGAGPGGSLVEVVVPAPAAVAEAAGRLAPGAVPGARIPVQAQAGEWGYGLQAHQWS